MSNSTPTMFQLMTTDFANLKECQYQLELYPSSHFYFHGSLKYSLNWAIYRYDTGKGRECNLRWNAYWKHLKVRFPFKENTFFSSLANEVTYYVFVSLCIQKQWLKWRCIMQVCVCMSKWKAEEEKRIWQMKAYVSSW